MASSTGGRIDLSVDANASVILRHLYARVGFNGEALNK